MRLRGGTEFIWKELSCCVVLCKDEREYRMVITQKQIAAEANVSLATVSLALNGSPIVAAKTREKILALARRLNYQPNLVARSLAGGSSKMFGLLIDSSAPRIQFQLAGFLEREAAQNGYRLMIGEAHDNVEHLYQMCQVLQQHGVEGIFCLAHDYPGQHDLFEKYFRNFSNLVFIGRPLLNDVSYIDIDRSQAIEQAVFHLHNQGYQHIGMISSTRGYQSDIAKTAAFLSALGQLGVVQPEKQLFAIDAPYEDAMLEKLYSKHICNDGLDALLANSDVEAAILCKFLQKKGLRIPEDFGVIGFDDDQFCKFTTPELSSINDELQMQAKYAVRILLDMTSDKKARRAQCSVTVRSSLIVRDSSCRFKV